MITNYLQQHKEYLAKILSAVSEDDRNSDFIYFIQEFYAKLPAPDLVAIAPERAVAIAKNAFEFLSNRIGSEPKIRIFTPEKENHGYEVKHMVLELINDDMPFLLDSLSMELTRQGFIIYNTIHPIFNMSRDGKGNISGFNKDSGKKESLIHFEISALPENLGADELKAHLEWVLRNVRASVDDWKKIVDKAKKTADSLGEYNIPKELGSAGEVKDFLNWLVDKNFVFLGYAEYDFFDEKGKEILTAIPESKLGILRIAQEYSPCGLESLKPEQRHFLLTPQLIEITKSNRHSLVHRNVPMDYIGIKRFDKKGGVIGEVRFLGLFTSNVYYQSTEEIPLIRHKVARVLENAAFDPASHDGKSLKTILEFLPRDEIFQMSEDEIFETSMGIFALEAKPTIRIFARKDVFERFVSFMVFVPRERFSTELRRQIQKIIENNYKGITSSFSTQIADAPLARLNLIIRTTPNDIPQVHLPEIEREIAKCAYMWSDLLYEALLVSHSEKAAEKLLKLYGDAFPQSYINRYNQHAAAYDINKIEEALAGCCLTMELFRDNTEEERFLHLKTYNPNEEIALSDILPILENAGFRVIEEYPFLIKPQNGNVVWIRDFRLEHIGNMSADFNEIKPLLEEALLKIWNQEVENDRFNALILKAGINWRQVVILRAYAKYLKQINFAQGQSVICQAFTLYPQIVKNIITFFEERFDPDLKQVSDSVELLFEEQLVQVASAVHDHIFRRYIDLIKATVRTNYFQLTEGNIHKPVLSLKFNSSLIPDLIKPVPYAEIFVYSVRVEGIHLRGGKVARGGLRWSDRGDDFRTEILGLVKAQMVKNSVIVPVGSKGGFVLKRPPALRNELQEEAVACYRLYLSGLLDVTDNIINGKITPPTRTVRHDGDDPYLVVAADKGTATFSDIANAISTDYNFWLGDAFASGGSAGYDHKKMGITARGAFISVIRHFAEMGIDIETTPFTAVGIGDMAGDVFGNGMLLSQNIRLVAAFNHLHIFIDPNPDEKTSFAERKRLFDLPRSNWTDYDTKLISKGGGIYERSAKSINLSPEAQKALGVDKANFSPDELIKAILLAPVDLLWNGGIGTYVKAESESDEQVGDRANNAVRVNGVELRCKIIGEGGNLGFTQRGRIEYARNGGRINTDAIDNSAGVDCSDHEVNIKIAFSRDIANKNLSLEKRNLLLSSMTDEVAELVLKDNILQTQAITMAQVKGIKRLDSQTRFIHHLEKIGMLNRKIEFLPDDKQIAEMKVNGKSLTRPELAVLVAYSKMFLYNELLASNLPDDKYFISDLKQYFPEAMRLDFSSSIEEHPLKREIIATVITNDIINRGGISFAFNISQDLSVSLRDVAAAYVIARDLFDLEKIWQEIDGEMNTVKQSELIFSVQKFMERTIFWLIRNMLLPLNISEIIADFFHDVKETDINLEKKSSVLDIIMIARNTGKTVDHVTDIYNSLGEAMKLNWLRNCARSLDETSNWDRLAAQALIGDFYDEQRRIVSLVINSGLSLDEWQKSKGDVTDQFEKLIMESQAEETVNLAKLMVALRRLRAFY